MSDLPITDDIYRQQLALLIEQLEQNVASLEQQPEQQRRRAMWEEGYRVEQALVAMGEDLANRLAQSGQVDAAEAIRARNIKAKEWMVERRALLDSSAHIDIDIDMDMLMSLGGDIIPR